MDISFWDVTIPSGIGVLLYFWLKIRLKESINNEYKKQQIEFKNQLDNQTELFKQELAKQQEIFKRELDRKEKVELVSEVLAEYLRTPPGENISREDRTSINKLSFKCSLWLSATLSKELSKVLQNKSDAKPTFEIILMARKELIDDENISLEHVTWWGYEKETQAVQEAVT